MSVFRSKKYQGGGRPQGTTAPQTAGFRNPLLTGEDIVAEGLKSAIPLAELFGSKNRLRDLRKRLPTKFSRVNLTAPVVRDMVRPSFAPRARAPLGSSLAERTAGQKFGDAFQTAQENQFEAQNELQKRQQEGQNIGILNQEEMTNAQIANQEAQLNANINLLDYKYNLGRRDTALNALNYYLATDPNQFIQGKHMRQLGRDNFIVQNPKMFGGTKSKQYLAAAARARTVPPTETTAKTEEERGARSGRKLKTRFSYGKRQ